MLTFVLTLVGSDDRLYPESINAKDTPARLEMTLEVIFCSIAPCLPDNIAAEIQCNTNVMNISWTQTPGSDNYTAWAISTNGRRRSCNSTSDSCSIHNLQCGETYEVAVTSSSMGCDIIAGSGFRVHSGQWHSICINVVITIYICQRVNCICKRMFFLLI